MTLFVLSGHSDISFITSGPHIIAYEQCQKANQQTCVKHSQGLGQFYFSSIMMATEKIIDAASKRKL